MQSIVVHNVNDQMDVIVNVDGGTRDPDSDPRAVRDRWGWLKEVGKQNREPERNGGQECGSR